MICPRCGESFADKSAPFRTAQRMLHECASCQIWLVNHLSPEHVEARLAELTRTSRTLDQSCPRCGTSLRRYMLSTHDREVDVEVCRTCTLLVVDRDEIEAAEALLGVALRR